LEQSWRHAVYERLGRQRHRHAAREMNEARLRYRIGDGRAGGGEPGDGGNIDDAAPPLRLHQGRYRFDQTHGSGQVDGHDRVPDLLAQRLKIAEGDRLIVGGVVDEDVDAPEASADRLDQLADGGLIGNVAGKCRRLDLVARAQ